MISCYVHTTPYHLHFFPLPLICTIMHNFPAKKRWCVRDIKVLGLTDCHSVLFDQSKSLLILPGKICLPNFVLDLFVLVCEACGGFSLRSQIDQKKGYES